MIRINVGGTIFSTLQKTLVNAGGLLRDMAQHPETFAHDDEGLPFLDRNPKRFETILDLCRNNGRSIRGKLPMDLLDDVEYLSITTRMPFLYEAGDQVELEMNGIVNEATIVSITLHGVVLKDFNWRTVSATHDVWDGATWRLHV